MEAADFKFLFEESPLLILIADNTLEVTSVSRGYLKIIKAETEEVAGKQILDLFPFNLDHIAGEGRLTIQETLNQVLQQKIPETGMYLLNTVSASGREVINWHIHYAAVQEAGSVKFIFLNIESTSAGNDSTVSAFSLNSIRQSEERFRRLVLQAPVAICVLRGADFIIDTINEQMVEMWGREASMVLNKPAFEVLPEFKDSGLKELLDQVYTTGERFVIGEFPLTIKRNGRADDIFVKFIYEPLIEGNGEITGVMALAHEITEQVVSRKNVEESERFIKQLFDSMPQIAWTNTAEGRIVFFNNRWLEFTGLAFRESSTGSFRTIIHPDDLNQALVNYTSILRSGMGGEFQLRGKRADGVFRWHLIRLIPSSIKEGERNLWIGTATDIHEIMLLQQQKDDFMNIASHELKTPVTSLKMSLQLLDENGDPKLNTKLIRSATRSMEKINALIHELFDSSMLTEGKISLNLKIVNLYDLIMESCQLISSKEILRVKVGGDIETLVQADEVRIEQVVMNLIDNALKYAPDSTEILILLENLGDRAKVSVTDRGPGIDPALQPFLFDRYYRGGISASQNTGLGLGLYISAEIIRLHNGDKGVESKPGTGSTFWFTLPIQPASFL